ncbi:LOW QUALITY PROTEIN: protein mono-ADP-ribosyltransferase PARP4 [Megaptera novaeangliae]
MQVKTDDPPLDNSTEKENTVELTKFYTENVGIPHFPQDFEVAKYNTLEKVGTEGGKETAMVELRCPQSPEDPGDHGFLISAHFLLADGIETRRQFSVKKTSTDASEYYENYIEELKKQGFPLREHLAPEATQLASEKLQALLSEEAVNSSVLSPEVSGLVEMLWAEALGHLEHTVLRPVHRTSLNDVSKAEGILLLVKEALRNGETEQVQTMMAEFYRLIPHRAAPAEKVSLRLLAKKEDLCLLIRDMVNLCETNLSKPNPPSLAKYRALRCKIEHVEPNTEEFFRVEVLQNNHSKHPVDILQIFRVGRLSETTEFLSHLGNVTPSLHRSPVQSFVGILSWNIPWDFEKIKKASEWLRRTEGQYPSTCQRLELGKDDSATKQLLGPQPRYTPSPLHRLLKCRVSFLLRGLHASPVAPNTLMRDPVSLLVPKAMGLLPPSSPMRHEAQDLSHYSHCRRPAPFGAVGPGPRGAGIFDYSAFCCLYMYKPSKSETGLLYLYWPNQSGLGPGLPCLFA